MPTPFRIEELEQLPDGEWSSVATLERMNETLEALEMANSVGTLRSLRALLESKRGAIEALERAHPGIGRLWEGWVSRCMFPSIASLSSAEVDGLFRGRFLAVARAYDDLRKSLDEQLYAFDYNEALVQQWTRLKTALQENVERLGREDIVKEGGKRVSPTVGAWVKEYRSFLHGNVKPGALEEAQFFIKDGNARKLSSEDRQTLLKILQLLDFFVNPPEADVEPTGHAVGIKAEGLAKEEGGQRSAQGVPAVDRQQQIKDIEPIIEELLNEDPERMESLVERVWDWSKERDERATNLPRVLAAVRVLAKRGAIHAVATGSPKETMGKLQGASGASLVNFLGTTLRTLYQDVWGMPEHEAAKEATHIGSILSKQGHPEYLALAYYDMMEKSFKWKQ